MGLLFTTEDLPEGDRPRLDRIAVIGSGAWGTALATVAHHAGREVSLWGRDPAQVHDININLRNSRHMPDVPLPPGLNATTDLVAALAGADAVLLATPSTTLREICALIRPHLPPGIPVAICCKGIERGTGLPLSQLCEDELPGHPIGALSGPTFARETALGHPTAATIAFPFTFRDRLHPEQSPAARLARAMASGTFRPYISDDLIGVEIGGAVKNVIAIACGMMTGAGFAENTRAALITRGMEEMKRLAVALGGRAETIAGLSGAGDLTLTCSSQTSRNMSLGVQLGQGTPRAACFDGRPVVVEGEINAVSVIDLARQVRIAMPICAAVHAILHEGASIETSLAALWSRPITGESGNLEIAIDHGARSSALSDLAKRTS